MAGVGDAEARFDQAVHERSGAGGRSLTYVVKMGDALLHGAGCARSGRFAVGFAPQEHAKLPVGCGRVFTEYVAEPAAIIGRGAAEGGQVGKDRPRRAGLDGLFEAADHQGRRRPM